MLAASACFAQNTPAAPQGRQPSAGYTTAQQAPAAQNTAAYSYGATLGFGVEPSNMTVSTEPSTLHVGLESSSLHVGIEPSTLHVGIEPSTLHVGLEPSSLHMGLEPSFPPYLGVMPPFVAARPFFAAPTR
jgi:hypothetical protein